MLNTTLLAATYTAILSVTGAPTMEVHTDAGEEEFTVTGVRISYEDGNLSALTVLTEAENQHMDVSEPDQLEGWMQDLIRENQPAA